MIGRFYFKRTVTGNLIGEFSNNFSLVIEAELAVPLSPTLDFIGTYTSTWVDTVHISATLSIKPKPETNGKIFSLEWREGDQITFWGEGMLCDQIIMGDYRDFETIPK